MRKGSGKSTAPKVFFYTGTFLFILVAAISVIGLLTGSINSATASMAFTLAFSLTLSFLVISYLLHKGKSLKRIVKELGLSRKALNRRTIGYGLLLFAIYVIIIFAIATISSITGVQINSNVQQTIGGYPIWALVFLSIIAPLNEEIAFRGFLVPRIGVLFSGLLFAVLHFGYGSVSEIVIALWFGLAGGYVFKRTKSLYPSLMTHILVNSITAIAISAIPMLIMVH
jgi:membrane protease YdiL (CAAX protease family)